MNEKRYQIFISSTFTDLSEERKAIMDAVLNLDCFPSGMEMFPASDMEQFEYIKRIIEESDYYILVVAGKYGSISENGISYTEMEYDYAKAKGVPILTFIKKDINLLARDKIELDPEKREKLDKFRDKISENNLVKYWDSIDELKFNVYDSLSKSIKMIKRTGWVRGDITTDAILLRQINSLRNENEELKEKILNQNNVIKSFKNDTIINLRNTKNLSQGDDVYKLFYRIVFYNNKGDMYEDDNNIELSWNEIFYEFGYKILNVANIPLVVSTKLRLIEALEGKILERDKIRLEIPDIYLEDTEIEISDKTLTTIILQLRYLNLIRESSKGNFVLTEEGEQIIVDRLLIKSNE